MSFLERPYTFNFILLVVSTASGNCLEEWQSSFMQDEWDLQILYSNFSLLRGLPQFDLAQNLLLQFVVGLELRLVEVMGRTSHKPTGKWL